MPETILIVGASGLLGHQGFLEARRRFGEKVHGIYRTPRADLKSFPNLHALDLLDTGSVKRLILSLKPAAVVNCAGVVKRICGDPYEAITINAAFPHLLANLVRPWNGRVLQVSTDCVFSGKKGGYTENDAPDADDLYGQSKRLGEISEAPHLTIRTSFIGYELETERGFLAWFLSSKGTIRGFRNVIWSGLTARYFAALLNELLFRREVNGLLHVAAEPIDKYSLLCLMAEVFGRRDIFIQPVDEPKENRSLKALRLRSFGISIPLIKEQLVQLRASQKNDG